MTMMYLAAVILQASFVATAAFVPHLTPTSEIATGVDMVAANALDDQSSEQDTARRAFVGAAAGLAASFALPTSPVFAATGAPSTKLEAFVRKDLGFEVLVPSGWERTEQTLPDRRVIDLFVDPTSGDDDKTIIFMAFTPVRDDFTQLGSFGSVDQVGQMTILPKGSLAGEETVSTMISAESKKNAYIFDYKAKVPQQPERHFRTIFALAQGPAGNAGGVLVTITAQTPESRYGEMKGLFDEIIDSYGKAK